MVLERKPPKDLPRLGSAELDVLKVLWRRGRLSAREIHEQLVARTGWAYSTTRTVVERMVTKGLLKRSAFHGLHLYEAAISRPVGLAGLVKSFAEDVLELRRVPVAALFAESEALTREELDELRALLDGRGRAGRSRRPR